MSQTSGCKVFILLVVYDVSPCQIVLASTERPKLLPADESGELIVQIGPKAGSEYIYVRDRDETGAATCALVGRSGHLDHQLAEVVAVEHADEGGRRVLQALDHVLAVSHEAVAEPAAALAQEVGRFLEEVPTMNPLRVMRLVSTARIRMGTRSGPGGNSVEAAASGPAVVICDERGFGGVLTPEEAQRFPDSPLGRCVFREPVTAAALELPSRLRSGADSRDIGDRPAAPVTRWGP